MITSFFFRRTLPVIGCQTVKLASVANLSASESFTLIKLAGSFSFRIYFIIYSTLSMSPESLLPTIEECLSSTITFHTFCGGG